jgi:hypothetical protein
VPRPPPHAPAAKRHGWLMLGLLDRAPGAATTAAAVAVVPRATAAAPATAAPGVATGRASSKVGATTAANAEAAAGVIAAHTAPWWPQSGGHDTILGKQQRRARGTDCEGDPPRGEISNLWGFGVACKRFRAREP